MKLGFVARAFNFSVVYLTCCATEIPETYLTVTIPRLFGSILPGCLSVPRVC